MVFIDIKGMIAISIRHVCIVSGLLLGFFYGHADGFKITNYLPDQYRGYNQNWSVDQSPTGIMYFGNNGGLLEFDGSAWTLHQSEDKLKYRSVYAYSDSMIYTGSFEEFGYWKRNNKGELIYHSIVDKEVENLLHNDEIWNILEFRGDIYFQSFSRIFRLRNGEVKYIQPPWNILFLSVVRDRLLVYVIGRGLYEMIGETFIPISENEIFANAPVPVMLPYGDDQVLVGTEVDGFYVLTESGIKPWETPASDFVAQHQLNRGIKTHEGKFIFGTIQNGIIVCDRSGNIEKAINQNKGLQNNTILGLHFDAENGVLWAALNNGIDLIDLQSPYIVFDQETAGLGKVFTAAYYHNTLYIGTNQGVYYKKIQGSFSEAIFDEAFRFLENTQGQVWTMDIQDDQLLMGHNQGTFRIEGRTIHKIADVNGGWDIERIIYEGREYLVQSTYTRLIVFQKDGLGNWAVSHQIDGLTEPIRFIEFDNRGNLWASHNVRGVYKLTLSQGMDSIVTSRFYGQAAGFHTDYNINVFKLNEEIVFTTNKKFYQYDALADSILPYDLLNNRLGPYASANRIVKVNGNQYWLISDHAFVLTSISGDKVNIEEVHPYQRFGDHISEQDENVIALNDTMIFFALPGGFSVYDRRNSKLRNKMQDDIFLRRVSSGNGLLPLYSIKEGPVEILYKNNTMEFQVAVPEYNHVIDGYQFKLEGLESEWSALQTEPLKQYVRLPFGKYTFMARAVDDLGNAGPSLSYTFRVLKPWYLSVYAIAGYLIIVASVAYLMYTVNRKRNEARQRKLRIDLEREKLEQLRKHRQAHEKQLMAIKNEKLQEQVNHKVKQLASSTMGVIKKNEVLLKVKDELIRHKRELEEVSGPKFVRSIFKIIDNNLTDDEDWSRFEQNFDQAHENFLRKLRENYPALTPKDLRFSAYLRMNLSSKEIASLLNISVRGVEVRRYRLRKKFGLDHDQNLVDFLMKVS